MADFLKGFMDNVISGALNPKGNLGDFAHASRLYVNDAFRLAPKVKFLYHVSFNINPQALAVIPQLREKHQNEINMLVKAVDLPKYTVQTDVKHQYNRKRAIQKRIDYNPINVQFHDDNFGVTTALWEAYYRYYYRDGNYSKVNPAGDPDTSIKQFGTPNEFNRGNAFGHKQYRYGFDNDSFAPFFNNIVIYQMSRKRYTAFVLVNPLISAWAHDTMDQSASDPVTNSMTLEYESVFYSRGPVSEGSAPKGFGIGAYDTTPSPNSLSGGGVASLGQLITGGAGVLDDISGGNVGFGTVLKAGNLIKNAGALGSDGLRSAGFSILKEGIGSVSGIDVSGVANTAFPKGSGGSGGLLTTVAVAGLAAFGAQAATAPNDSDGTASPVSNSETPQDGVI